MYNLSKEQAFEEMLKGNKITHRYFTSEEYLEFDGCCIIEEKGYSMDKRWNDSRQESTWKLNGYKLYVEV